MNFIIINLRLENYLVYRISIINLIKHEPKSYASLESL
jgi:hypothetical protein